MLRKIFMFDNTHKSVGNAFHKRGPATVTVNLRKFNLWPI